MKNNILFFCLIISTWANAQLSINSNKWEAIGVDTQIRQINTDIGNTDGNNDGALHIDGMTPVTGQGVKYVFDGLIDLSQNIEISTFTFNPNSSHVKYRIELFNSTDNRELVYKDL